MDQPFDGESHAFVVADPRDKVLAVRTFRAGPDDPVAIIAGCFRGVAFDGARDWRIRSSRSHRAQVLPPSRLVDW